MDEVAERVAHLIETRSPRCGSTHVLAVDGPAGSGKSTLAGVLAARLGAGVVRLDDLFDGWDQQLGDRLARHLEAWLLLPWRDALVGRHPAYDWGAARYTSWRVVQAAPVMILDGCGSASKELRPWLTAAIWVDADKDHRLARGLARDGEHLTARWLRWLDHEDEHFMADATSAAADIHVDGESGAIIRP